MNLLIYVSFNKNYFRSCLYYSEKICIKHIYLYLQNLTASMLIDFGTYKIKKYAHTLVVDSFQ